MRYPWGNKNPPGSSITIELKPKWLAQSPNAPISAVRCRTCAIQAQRRLVGTPSTPVVCPLALLHGDGAALETYVKPLIRKELGNAHTAAIEATLFARIIAYMTQGPGHALLEHLGRLQQGLDPHGVLQLVAERVEPLCLAMALRDCSLFLRVPYADPGAPIEAKLADLDFKSEDKVDDWVDKEKKLIGEGWYVDRVEREWRCWLEQGAGGE